MAVDNKYITVAYKLYAIEDGEEDPEVLEECTAQHPFQFISQLGVVLPAFEAGVTAVGKGEKFDFIIPCKDAYGEFNEEMMFDVPKAIFMPNGKIDDRYIYEGAVVPLQNAEGQRFNGTIIKIENDVIIVDLNHPLAGKSLNFKGEIIENREASPEEISGMLKMITGEGCGGGCGSCGGNCGGDCEGGCEGGCGSCGGCK